MTPKPDPSVSPADTIRHDPADEAEEFVAAALVGKEWEARDSDGEPPTWVERGFGDECERFIETPLSYDETCRIERLLLVARELLAVGERDKAEREQLQAQLEAEETILYARSCEIESLVAERERDRRQIAQLTEILRDPVSVPQWGVDDYRYAIRRARAVLACEEDAE